MHRHFRWFVYLIFLAATSCFWKKEAPAPAVTTKTVVKPAPAAEKDKGLDNIIRYFAFADGIHREAWWVLSEDKRPIGKSPFGKVQRALLSSQNVKLTNKSLFRCDRYVVKRDILSPSGYPQRFDVFEKCSEKADAKRLAELDVPKEGEVQVAFFPDNLEEVLGMSASILNRKINCTLRGTDEGQLTSLQCKDWSQERSKEHMIRLDTYDYQKEGKNLIKLRGKVFEHLTDIRKIEADVPLEGKIIVTETELYAPQEDIPPAVTPAAPKQVAPAPGAPGYVDAPVPTHGAEAVPAERTVDPDVMMQRRRGEQMQPGVHEEYIDHDDPANHGLPPGEAPGEMAPPGAVVEGLQTEDVYVDEEGNETPVNPLEPAPEGDIHAR